MTCEIPDAQRWLAPVVERRDELLPIQTSHQPRLMRLDAVKAVVFDIYGTLLVSGSGDVGTANDQDRGQHLEDAYQAVGLSSDSLPDIAQWKQAIESSHRERRSDQVPKPEVDIVDVWRVTLRSAGYAAEAERVDLVCRLAAEYEARANPTWPMPGAGSLLRELAEQDMRLGIVSNAQVFTPLLIEDLLGESLTGSGFDPDLCVFSNRFRQAKPGPRLFDVLVRALGLAGVMPEEALYVGNDMLNDVWAASQAGLRTAWFAGDARSCRQRQDDDRCREIQPDLVLTKLSQVLDCIG
ncbi:MAG: HAD family hydrolase [Planctomycetota bacterium]